MEGTYIKKSFGDLGIAPALVYAIFQVAVVLFQSGYSYYTGLQEARRQQREQRYLSQLEMSQLAELLFNQYPAIKYNDWLDYVVATNIVYGDSDGNNIPNTDKTDWSKYLPYAIVGFIIFMVTKK